MCNSMEILIEEVYLLNKLSSQQGQLNIGTGNSFHLFISAFCLANTQHRNFNNIQKYCVEISALPIRAISHRDEKSLLSRYFLLSLTDTISRDIHFYVIKIFRFFYTQQFLKVALCHGQSRLSFKTKKL